MTEIASLFATIGADLTGLEAGLATAAGSLEATGKRMGAIGQSLTMAITLPLAAIGVAAAKAAIDLDAEMRNIQSISKQSDESLAGLQQRFIDLSADITVTTDSAANLASGFYNIQSSGFAGEDAMTVLLAATKAASAGLTTTEVAAKGVTAALNAYGEGADQAGYYSDLMFRAVDRGVMTFEELVGSLSNVVGTAASANVGFETISAALATMTKQGMSAAEASVSLNQVILALVKPSDDMAEALRNIGFESGEAALESLGLAGTLGALEEAGYDSTTEMAGLFGNVRALRGALALTGDGAKLFAEDLEAMGDVAGATEEAFRIQTQSLEAQLANLKNTAVALGIEMFQLVAPSLEKGIQTARDMLQAFRELDPSIQLNIIRFAGLAAAVGPAMFIIGKTITVVSGLVSGVQAAIGVINSLTVAWKAWNAGMTLTTALGAAGIGPIAIALGAVALAVGAVVAVWYQWNKQIVETNRAGQEAVGGTWEKFFSDLESKGASASEVLDEYRAAQDRVTAALESANPVVRAFIKNQDDLKNADVALAETLFQVSTSYEEYVSVMQEAGMLLMVASEDQWELAHATEGTTEAVDGMTQALEPLQEKLMTVDEILSAVEEELGMAGLEGIHLQSTMDTLSVALGQTTESELALESAVRLVSQAFAAGAISEQEFTDYLTQAREGTLQLSEAQRSTLENAVAYQQSLRDSALAAQELAMKQLDLAQALKGATEAQIAQAAITELKNALDSGQITFEQYALAVGDVQTKFGLVDAESQAVADGILRLTDALSRGQLPAENFGSALKQMADDAKAGTPNIQGVLDVFGTAPETLSNVSDSMADLGGNFEELASGAETTTGDVEDAFVDMSGGVTKTMSNLASATTQSLNQIKRPVNELSQALNNLDEKDITIRATAYGFQDAINWVNNLKNAINSLPDSVQVQITIAAEQDQSGGGGGGSGAGGGGNYPTSNTPILPGGIIPGTSLASGGPQTVITNTYTYNINDALAAAMILEQQRSQAAEQAAEMMR